MRVTGYATDGRPPDGFGQDSASRDHSAFGKLCCAAVDDEHDPGAGVHGDATEPHQAAEDRDRTAEDRDRRAEAHDDESQARDDRADARDVRAEARELAGNGIDQGSAADRVGAKRDREGGASDRTQAADDRSAASADRVFSARDREAFSLDDLTGAMRREVGIVGLDRELTRAKRTNQPFTLAFVDVDQLKAINDSLGHAAGDRVLRETADSIRHQLRAYDLIVRYGGDEFLCGIIDVPLAEAVKRFACVNADLAAAHQASVTVGLAECQEDDALEDLIARADKALYRERERQRPADA